VTNGKNRRRTNGHAGPHGQANGHGQASTERGGVPVHGDQAASDDASGASVAIAAVSATVAGTAREACADAAPPALAEKNGSGAETSTPHVHFPGPTDSEAMQDAGAYVNAVAERVDLVAASVRLVESRDEKIAKSELDRLREMKFGKVGPAAAEEPPRLDFSDWPRPQQ
jgi:hypothetical protein